jgi:heme o synthase
MATESTIPVPRGLALPQKAKRPLLSTVASYWALTKPDINLLIAITVFLSFGLAARFPQSFPLLLRLLNAVLGTLLVSSGAAALNQFMERRFDGFMRRTARRPVVIRGVSPGAAFIFGMCISGVGTIYLYIFVNLLSALIGGAAFGIYLALYTPLKRITPLCTWVGAISGAAPPLIGWAAASGSLNQPGAWTLYTMLFLWQFPHFMAIAWMYREDYDRAGYKILPHCKCRDRFAAVQSLFPASLMVLCSAIPALIGIAGKIYLTGALVLSIGLLYYAIRLTLYKTNSAARRLLFASIVYLPSVFLLMLLDKR